MDVVELIEELNKIIRTKRTLGPAGAPVSKKTGKVFMGEGIRRLLRPKGIKKK